MQSTALDKGRFSRLAMTLAMLAVVIRVLVPAGFMVAPGSEAGGSRIVICSGQGAVEVLVDEAGHRIKAPANHGQDKAGDHACAFASVATASLSPEQLLLSAPAAYVDLVTTPKFLAQRPGLGLAAPPPPKTGPPLSI